MFTKQIIYLTIILIAIIANIGCNIPNDINNISRPNWQAIKANATFIVPDTSYGTPYIQPINVGGWEDGLYISRDGLELYAYYMPVDVFSLGSAWKKAPVGFDYRPYYRPPLLNVDMVTNPWGFDSFFQGDIIISTRKNIMLPFCKWQSSNFQRSVSNEGAPCGVLKDKTSYDVFVFTQNRNDIEDMEIMFMRDVPRNPKFETSVPIVSSTGVEDNPHIERLNDNSLLLIFDRDRYMYYSISNDDGNSWQKPELITQVLNDQAPYDVQPHLWNDGNEYWVYFCADNENGKRCIYKSKQQIKNNWDSWGARELVIEPGEIIGESGTILGVGEPSLTQQGDISFVVIYGDLKSKDKTDVFDCDPWFLPKNN